MIRNQWNSERLTPPLLLSVWGLSANYSQIKKKKSAAFGGGCETRGVKW